MLGEVLGMPGAISKDMVVFKTYPHGQVVLTPNVDVETVELRRERNGYWSLPV